MAMAPMADMVRAALSAFGFRNAGTPLEMASTPVSAVQPEENARSANVVRALGLRCIAQQRAEQTDADHQQHAADEGVGRDGERSSGFADPAQIHRCQYQDEADVDHHAVGIELRERGDDVVDPGRHGHGNGHHVVHQQCGGHHQTGDRAEVRRRDLVGTAPTGVGLHHLSVGQHHDGEEQHHRGGDPRCQIQVGQAAEGQDQENFLGRVGDGRKWVAREDRQRDPLWQQGVAEAVAAERPPEQQAFQQRRR
jgi:hypothetical protein